MVHLKVLSVELNTLHTAQGVLPKNQTNFKRFDKDRQ